MNGTVASIAGNHCSSLPPIDLTAAADTLESTAVLILAPVPRNERQKTAYQDLKDAFDAG